MSLEDRIERIERGVQGLSTRLDGLPDEALYRAPADGEWPVMSTLAHVVEMLPYWAQQSAQIARSPGAPFGRMHDDPGRLGAIDEHGRDSVDTVRAALRTSLDDALAILRTLPADALDRAGMHPRRGAMTVREVIDSFMVHHVEEHAAQIDAALQALGYSPSQVP